MAAKQIVQRRSWVAPPAIEVVIGVTANLMTVRGDCPNDIPRAFGPTAEQEKRGLDLDFAQPGDEARRRSQTWSIIVRKYNSPTPSELAFEDLSSNKSQMPSLLCKCL